jgi:hypothetical protein
MILKTRVQEEVISVRGSTGYVPKAGKDEIYNEASAINQPILFEEIIDSSAVSAPNIPLG